MKNGDKLPQSLDAEKGLLGSILLAPRRVMDEQAGLHPSYFYHPSNVEIFSQLLAMRAAGKPIDLISLTQWLDDRNVLENVGGAAYVTDLFTFVPTASNAAYYAELVREKALARRVITFADQLKADAIDPAKQKDLQARVKAALAEMSELPAPAGTLPPMVSARQLCLKPPPVPAEIIEGVLHQGSKLALGGGSKSFKTWTLLEMAICVATGRDWLGFTTTAGRVLYVNFELPAFAIQKRVHEICEAMSIEVPENLDLWNLRGHATDAGTILPIIAREAKRGSFAFMILDPIYKLLGSRDENASRDMTDLMNQVERLSVETGAAVAFGSHFAKGNASGKESMDRISGSGVFARDPDSIVTLTQHEQPGAFSVEMTLRNFPPQEPFVVRREHPLMVMDSKLDPGKLKQPGGRKEEVSADDVLGILGDDAVSYGEWLRRAEEELFTSSDTFKRRLRKLKAERRIRQSAAEGGKYVRA